MTREEASAAAERLNAGHPERDRFRWAAHEAEGAAWDVARIALPKPLVRERFVTSSPGKQTPPPDRHPGELPGGVSPWAAGGA